jgi:hypothetical protein
MLKDLTGEFNVSAELDVDLEENYSFDEEQGLTEAEMFLETKVHDWYSVTSAHQLVQITKEAAITLKEEMNAKYAEPVE